jgi:4-diphosphocytidyl-2-C-methyl-D-erythritol kinase
VASPPKHDPSSPPLRLFAPAKINWALTIQGRRPDGFHDIDTIFQTLAFGDELVCRPLAEPVCRLRCDAPGIPTDGSNLVVRAWQGMAERFPQRVRGLDVELIKRIPAGAGLGGGSSDAVAALVAIDRLYGLRLPPRSLEELAATLGSDCAFFVRGGTARGRGRGEALEPLVNRLPPIWLVVTHPGFGSPTAAAYRQVRPEHWEDGTRVEQVARCIEAGRLDQLKEAMVNIFSGLLMRDDLAYQEVKDTIIGNQLERPMLTGSGSALIAFARNGRHARQAANAIRGRYPFAVATRLRAAGVRVAPH